MSEANRPGFFGPEYSCTECGSLVHRSQVVCAECEALGESEFNGVCDECGEVLCDDGSCEWCDEDNHAHFDCEPVEPDVDEAQEWYDFDPDC